MRFTFLPRLFTLLLVSILTLPLASSAVDSLTVSGFTVDDDSDPFEDSRGNSNGLVEYGEIIEWILDIRNHGTAATNVSVTISTTDPLINITDATVVIGGIGINGTVQAVDFDFTVDSSIVERDVIFSVVISSDQGTFNDQVSLHVIGFPASVVAAILTIDDDNIGASSGNGDGDIDAGETIQLGVRATNNGGQAAVDCGIQLSSRTGNINFSNDLQLFGTIAAAASADKSGFIFTANSNLNTQIDTVDFLVVANNGSWSGYFTYALGGGPPKIEIVTVIIDDDNAGASSGNDDGKIQKNEIVELPVTYRNTGGTTATGISGILRSLDPDVTVPDSTVSSMPDVEPDSTRTSSSRFDIAIGNVNVTKQVKLEIEFTTNEGVFTDTVEVTIHGNNVLTLGTRIYKDDQSGEANGNGNGQVNAGERIELSVRMVNTGGDSAKNVHLSLSTVDTAITLLRDTSFLSFVVPDSFATFPAFLFDADTGASNQTVNMVLTVTSDSETKQIPFTFNMFGTIFIVYGGQEIDDDELGTSDGNANGIVDAGESIEFLLDLKNKGGNTATGVSAQIFCSSEFITLTDSFKTSSSIPGLTTARVSSDFDFDVSPNTPTSSIQFELEVITAQGTFLDTFFVDVTGTATLNKTGLIINDDTIGPSNGNNDSLLNAFEDAELSIEISNVGGASSTNTYAILSSGDPDLRVVTDSIFFGTIPTGSNGQFAGFLVSLAGTINSGLVPMTLTFHYTEGTKIETFDLAVIGIPNIAIDTLIFSDDSNGGSSGDGDGIPEAGESMEVLVQLENFGGANATGVTVKMISLDTAVVITDSIKTTSSVNAKSVKLLSSDFDFTIHPNTADKQATIQVDISSPEGSWTDFFTLDIKGVPNLEYNAHFIDDDNIGVSSGDNSGTLDASESIELDIFVENTGQNLASDVSVEVSSQNAGVQIIADSSFIGNIGPGVTAVAFDFFFILDTVYAAETLTLDLLFTSNEGSWTDQLVLPVVGLVDIVHHSSEISDDTFGGSQGDGDSIAEAGELIEIVITLENLGGGVLNNIEALLTSPDSNITILDSLKSISKINGLEVYKITSDFDFEIADATPSGNIPFNLQLTGDEGVRNVAFTVAVVGKSNLQIASGQINDDNLGQSIGDGDTIAEAGETIELDFLLENIGGVDANTVAMSIELDSITSTFINLLNDTAIVGSVSSGGTALAGTFELELNRNMPSNQYPVLVTIYSDAEVKTEEFLLTVTGLPDLYFGNYTVDDDNLGSSLGNANNLIDAGEAIELLIGIANLGGARATNVEIEVTSNSPYVTMIDSTKYTSSVSAGSLKPITSDLDFYVAPNTPDGSLSFNLEMQTDQGSFSRTFSIPVFGKPLLQLDDTARIFSTQGLDTVAFAGDNIDLSLEIANRGTVVADSTYAILSVLDTSLTVTTDSVYIGSLNPGDSVFIPDFDFFVAANARSTDAIFTLDLYSKNLSWSEQFELPIQGLPDLKFGEILIDDDRFGDSFGNADMVVNSGESIEFLLKLKNIGGARANGIVATVSCSDTAITITDSTKFKSSVSALSSSQITSDFDFDVHPLTGTRDIWFQLEMAAEEGVFLDSFLVSVVAAPILNFVGASVDDDSLGLSLGNGNLIPDAGETVEIELSLDNLGPAVATNVNAYITSFEPSIQVIQDSVLFGSILPGDTTVAGFAVLHIDSNVIEQAYNFEVRIVSDQSTITSTFSFTPNGLIDLAYVNHLIDDDNLGSSLGNGDSTVDAGETIELYIEIENRLNGRAENIVGIIGTSDPYITITDASKTMASLGPMDSASFSSDFDFVVAAAAPSHVASMYIDFTAEGMMWTDTFYFPVAGKPVFVIETVVVDDDQNNASNGDNDGLAEAGETVELEIEVVNIGVIPAFNITPTLTTSSPLVNITGSLGSFADSLRDGDTIVFTEFSLTVDSNVSYVLVPCTLSFATNQGNFSKVFNLRVNGFVNLRVDSVLISDDKLTGSNGNGDGIINAGESIELQPYVFNEGPGRARFITMKLKTNSPVITITDSVIAVSDIAVGTTRLPTSDFDFKVADTASAQTVEFYLTTNTAEGTYLDTFQLNIAPGTSGITLSSIFFDDDQFGSSYGDGDGKLEAGETVSARFSLENLGTRRLNNVKVTLESSSVGVTIIDTSFVVSSISSLSTITASSGLNFSLWSGLMDGTIDFRVNITADEAVFDTIITVNVFWAKELKIVVDPPTSGCTTEGAGFYNPLEFVTAYANPCSGYTFVGWRENGKIVGTADSIVVQTGSGGTLTAVYREWGVGFGEDDLFQFVAYPNPFSDQLVLQINSESNLNDGILRVYNSVGILTYVDRLDVTQGDVQLSTADWPAGFYVLEMEIENELKRLKLIKN